MYLALTAVGFVMMIWPDAYLFGIEHLGLGLSRLPPMVGAIVPGMIAAAIALDRVLSKGFSRPWVALVISILPLAFAAARYSREAQLDAPYVAISVILTAGTAGWLDRDPKSPCSR